MGVAICVRTADHLRTEVWVFMGNVPTVPSFIGIRCGRARTAFWEIGVTGFDVNGVEAWLVWARRAVATAK